MIQIVGTYYQIFSSLAILLLGIGISAIHAKWFHLPVRRTLGLYCWHTMFCMVYAQYVLNYGGDAVDYYLKSLDPGIPFSLGTAAVIQLARFFSSFLGLSFLGVFLVFHMFGFVGLLAVDASLRTATWNKSKTWRRLATVIVLLPSVSFWSSAIGKDSLSFMAAGLALWAALDMRRRTLIMASAVFVMLFVRPHMAGIIVGSIGVSMLVQSRVSFAKRLLLVGVSLAGAVMMLPHALDYSGLGMNINMDSITTYIEVRQSHNLDGGGGIDISGMNLPMKMFTYLFRPLPFEAHNVFALMASLDNVILLGLILCGAWKIHGRGRQLAIFDYRAFLWIYSLVSLGVLSSTTANLGISVRQKWMFAPMLIYLSLSVLGKKQIRLDAPDDPHLHMPTLERKRIPVMGRKSRLLGHSQRG